MQSRFLGRAGRPIIRSELGSKEWSLGLNIVADQPHTNSFADVHKKIKVFKDRIAEASRDDAEVRESKLLQEAADILDHDAT